MNRYKSKLDKEQKKKRELEESLDYLKEVESSAEGGRKYVVDKLKEEEAATKRDRDTVASILQGDPKVTYHNRLSAYGQAGLETLDWPDGWERYCLATFGQNIRIYGKTFSTKLGILIIVRDDKSNVYVRGVLTTLDPVIDMKNVDTLVIQAENTIDSAKGLLLSDNKDTASTLKKTKSGIYLPD